MKRLLVLLWLLCLSATASAQQRPFIQVFPGDQPLFSQPIGQCVTVNQGAWTCPATFEQALFANVAALRNASGAMAGQVYVQGTSTQNDGGEGFFYWNWTSTTPDDNGVTAIKPTWYGNSAGRWLRLNTIPSGVPTLAGDNAFTGSNTFSGPFSSPGVLSNILNTVTANYTIASSDCGNTVQAGTGSTGFFTITVPAVTGFPSVCSVNITNGDSGRGKGIGNFSGCNPQKILWPNQTCGIAIVNGAWVALRPSGRWKLPNSAIVNYFTDFTNGTDVVGATDGLAAGASALKTVNRCAYMLDDQIDAGSLSQSQIICNPAAATDDTQAVHISYHGDTAQGGAGFQIIGASRAVTGAVSNGGLCEITINSTATYSANEVVSVYGVGGATGCNGTWKVTVTDSTHLTLQNTTFGGAYTSGGTVTDGSRLTSSSGAFQCFFNTVVQLQNLTFASSASNLDADWGCKVYINPGNIFAGSPASSHILTTGTAQARVEGDIGIASGAGNAFLQAQTGGRFLTDIASNINFLPGVNPSFSGLGFAYADSQSAGIFNGLTINLNGNTVTGPRCAVTQLGLLTTSTGVANTFFPGNSNCTQASGGTIDAVTVARTAMAYGSGTSTTLAANTTAYMGTQGGFGSNQLVAISVPNSGTLRNLTFSAGNAPGAGQSYTITAYIGAYGSLGATLLTCTISGASATSCTDSTHTNGVTGGQTLAIQVISSTTAASMVGASWGLEEDIPN